MANETIDLRSEGGRDKFKRAQGGMTLGPQKGPASLGQIRAQTAMVNQAMTPDSIWLTLPKLPKATHPNGSHGHWATVKDAKKKQKEAAYLVAKEAMGNAKGFPWKAATVLVTYFTVSDKTDADNLLAWLKSSIDSLQTAGLIENDSSFSFPPVLVERVKRGDPRSGTFQLIITKTA